MDSGKRRYSVLEIFSLRSEIVGKLGRRYGGWNHQDAEDGFSRVIECYLVKGGLELDESVDVKGYVYSSCQREVCRRNGVSGRRLVVVGGIDLDDWESECVSMRGGSVLVSEHRQWIREILRRRRELRKSQLVVLEEFIRMATWEAFSMVELAEGVSLREGRVVCVGQVRMAMMRIRKRMWKWLYEAGLVSVEKRPEIVSLPSWWAARGGRHAAERPIAKPRDARSRAA